MNSLAQAEFDPGLRGDVVEVVKSLAPEWENSYSRSVFGIPWGVLRSSNVRIPSGAPADAGYPDTLDVGETMDGIVDPRDEALSAALARSFLTARDREEWAAATADAPRFDLESLDPDEILFRPRNLEDFVVLAPDDQLTQPSLMLQLLSAPGRVDILKVRPNGSWSITATGSCSAESGDCVPGPLGCCRWHEGQEGRPEGYVCRCPRPNEQQ